MKTIAIIPARGGSKRLPGKNLMLLEGIPLIGHSIRYAQANPTIIDEIVVSTDCPNIKQVAIDFGAKVIDRPEYLSDDLSTTVSALKHVLQTYGYNGLENVVLLQPTNPLRPKKLLIDAFEIVTKGKHQSLFTVSPNVQKFGKIENNVFIPFNYEYGQRSQDLAPLFYENGLLYISKANLVTNDILLDSDAFPFVTEHPFAKVDIDDLADFEFAQYLLKKHADEC